MVMCTTQSISTLSRIFGSNPSSLFRLNSSFAFRQAQLCRSIHGNGLHSRYLSVARAIEENSNFATEERESAVAVEVESPTEKNVYSESISTEPPPPPPPQPKEDTTVDEQVNDFLADLNVKIDSEDTYSILLYGVGAIAAVWLASAVVGSIDSIPLFPKLMEVVGLGYTLWFTSRYLLFKKNRDELFAKVEDLKQQVFGSSDD